MELLVDKQFDPQIGVLSEDETKHCVNVMRHRIGDNINITDGNGHLYECTLSDVKGRNAKVRVENTVNADAPKHVLHIAVAPTKNTDRFEWFVEKAVEMGVSEITPLVCDHSERTHLRLDRLERLVVAACKQSLKYHLPIVNEPIEAKKLIALSSENQRFILHCKHNQKEHLFKQAKTQTSTLVLIGPEGDFSDEEIALALKSGFNEATLGPERLRTETAAMVACHIIDLKNTIE